jgi:hypothetical protein
MLIREHNTAEVDMDQPGTAASTLRCSMSTNDDHRPGLPAPKAGVYRLLNVFGGAEDRRVEVRQGQPLPTAPRGHSWRLESETNEGASE